MVLLMLCHTEMKGGLFIKKWQTKQYFHNVQKLFPSFGWNISFYLDLANLFSDKKNNQKCKRYR